MFISFILFVPASSSLFFPPPRPVFIFLFLLSRPFPFLPVLKKLCRYLFEPFILKQYLEVRRAYVCPWKGRRFTLCVRHWSVHQLALCVRLLMYFRSHLVAELSAETCTRWRSQLTSHWHLLLSECSNTGINLRCSTVYLCQIMNVSHVCVILNARPGIVHFTWESEADGADGAVVL